MQRLDPEKDTITALRSWALSGLASEGWNLRIVGKGSQRRALETWVRANDLSRVQFVDWTEDVAGEFASAGILLATAPCEPLGLVVLEAMAAGLPVLAAAGGGHLETIGTVPAARLFRCGDAAAAAAELRELLQPDVRAELSERARSVARASFNLGEHVDRLIEQYHLALATQRLPPLTAASCEVR
jgi:glycosyltransferase involved in cell wall biosynthesis